jgi:hypothetical protein
MRSKLLICIALSLPGLPVLAQNTRLWSTYYGGATDEYTAQNMATDPDGNVYITGETDSPGLAAGGFQNTLAGSTDAFLAKFDPAGNRLWATYYGGTQQDRGIAVAVDPWGNVYLTGLTWSSLGIASGGFDNSYNGSEDCFLVKFDSSGNRLWGTYYGGSSAERGWTVCTDTAGNVYVGGETGSNSGIASGGFQNTPGGNTDAYLVKFDAAGNRIWATYYGGTGNDYGLYVASDPAGNVYLAGGTTSSSGIASGGFQNVYGGTCDAYLVKFDPAGTRLWSTYYGDQNYDVAHGLVTTLSGHLYLSGQTASTSNISSGGFQNTYGGGNYDGYLVKFDSLGNREWATYFGGIGLELFYNVAVDSLEHIYAAGFTDSPFGSAPGGFQTTFGGGLGDNFLVTYDSSGSRLCVSYFGGGGLDEESSIAIGTGGKLYFYGGTFSTSGIASGGFQNNFGGSRDVFLARLTSCALPGLGMEELIHAPVFTLSPNPCGGTTRLSTTLQNADISIHNSLGQLIYRGRLEDGQAVIDLPSSVKGLCLISLTSGRQQVSARLIVN